MTDDRFDVNFTRLASSIEELRRYRSQLENNSVSFADLKSRIQQNWSSDSAVDLPSLNKRLDDCINCIDQTVIPVLNKTIEIMEVLGSGTKQISSTSL